MAKKKQELTADEAVEQATLEANVVAQEAAEARVVVTPETKAEMLATALSEGQQHERSDVTVVTEATVPPVTLMPDGRYRETGMDHARAVSIDGQSYEHVAEDADGHWIYART